MTEPANAGGHRASCGEFSAPKGPPRLVSDIYPLIYQHLDDVSKTMFALSCREFRKFGIPHNIKGKGLCFLSACYGYLGVLVWAHKHKCLWDEFTCAYAALYGHLETLRWLHEHGCSWNTMTCDFAAGKGNLEVLCYARTNGCPASRWTCVRAISRGDLEMLKFAYSNGCPLREEAYACAVEGGHLEILGWLYDQGCRNEHICDFARQYNRPDILAWAIQKGLSQD